MVDSDQPLSQSQKTARRAFSVVSAEGVGLAVSMGAIVMARGLAGSKVDKAKAWAAESVVLPMLTQIENLQAKMGRGKAPDDNALTMEDKSPEERAKDIANTLVDFSIMWPIGFAARLGVQGMIDDRIGVPVADKKQYIFSNVVDKGIASATIVGLNSVASGPAKVSSDGLAKMFNKLGMPKETADSLGKYMIYMQIPNATGMAANIATLNHLNRKIDGEDISR